MVGAQCLTNHNGLPLDSSTWVEFLFELQIKDIIMVMAQTG